MTYAKVLDDTRRDAIRKLEEFRRSHNADSSELQQREAVQ